MESKKINQLATELTPQLSDLTIIGDPTTGISRKITLSQMAALFTGTVEEYPNLASFPLVGAGDTIFIAIDTNVLYRWDGAAYVELSPNIINSLVFNDGNGFDGTIVLSGSVATLTITTALTLGSVPFIGASGALIQDNANLFFDDANNRLGIGTNTPTTPLDVFGSGIIARVNGTSTNNGFLGFANSGTNKWSLGNVQSDHRFRIFSEANTAELISLLQTGEFGIGVANPTTKLHIDGGATALIANLDANVSVAKSLSFRSDNSNRINLEVSGTESGSNAGANFFIRRYSDAGALIDTPLTITRSSGLITLATALTGTIATFKQNATSNGSLSVGSAAGLTMQPFISATSEAATTGFRVDASKATNISAATGFTAGAHFLNTDFNATSGNLLNIANNQVTKFTIDFSGAATFNTATISGAVTNSINSQPVTTTHYINHRLGNGYVTGRGTTGETFISSNTDLFTATITGASSYLTQNAGSLSFFNAPSVSAGATPSFVERFTIATTGAATFSSTITTGAPSGGTAKPFKIGNVATVSPTSPNRTIEIEIDGTTYYLSAKTTNN